MEARSVMISLTSLARDPAGRSSYSLSTFLESDTRNDLGLFTVDGGNGNSDGRRNNAGLGRGVCDIGSDHEGILGEELGHGDSMGNTTELGVDLHRH